MADLSQPPMEAADPVFGSGCYESFFWLLFAHWSAYWAGVSERTVFKKLKRRSVAFVAVVVLLLVNLAGPASAGYREGRIGCQRGYDLFTESYSGGSYVVHQHYLESYRTREYDNARFAFTIWVGASSRYTWSVQATPLLAGGAGCG